MADKPRHVLDGYKVLDFTQFLAGPTVTRMMAEMGADIIKVEIAPIGDFSRGLPFIHDGRSAYYIQQNRGKKSLCIDPRKPEGLKILKDLVRTVDVMVENFSPGVIGRLGLDYATVSALNPRIVMCSISSMGQTGPLASFAGFGNLAAAISGSMGLAPGANLNPEGTSLFEPVHGSAPTIAGLHRANPIAAIWAGAMMLEFLGENTAADAILEAIGQHLREGKVRTPDLGGSSRTQDVGDDIVTRL